MPCVPSSCAGLHQLDALGLRQQRQEVVVGALVEVDLAVDQGRHGRLGVGDPDQLDAVDTRDLGAGEGDGGAVRGT